MTCRILVVEDELLVAEDIRERLVAEGYEVVGMASTAEGAITKATELTPDLVLMDIVLRGASSGIDAAAHVRERLGIPVVYLTANSDRDTLARAKVTEPFGYILKPFDTRELVSNIEMALYKHRTEREREALIARLTAALAEIEQLRGLLPICAKCKKIRDDRGYWTRLETFLHDRTGAEFTHGLCPECVEEFMAEAEASRRGE